MTGPAAPRVRYGLLGLALVALAVLRIGDFGVRLANTGEDDNPVNYARYWADPGQFEGDILETYAPVYTFGSAQNWLAAWLLLAFEVPPGWLAWLVVMLQNVLLGFAVLWWAKAATDRDDVAWLSVPFALAAHPWAWNLAHLNSQLYNPYAQHLALPVILLAATAAVRGRRREAAAWLVIAAWIHPSVTVFAIGVHGLHTLIAHRRRDWRTELTTLALLALAACVCVLPAWLGQSSGEDRISDAEMLAAFRLNGHRAPWIVPRAWYSSLALIVGIVVVSLRVLRTQRVATGFRAYWIAAAGASALFGTLHVAGMQLGSSVLVQGIGLRATILLVMTSLPLVILFLRDALDTRSLPARWAAMVLLLGPAFPGVVWKVVQPAIQLALVVRDWGLDTRREGGLGRLFGMIDRHGTGLVLGGGALGSGAVWGQHWLRGAVSWRSWELLLAGLSMSLVVAGVASTLRRRGAVAGGAGSLLSYAFVGLTAAAVFDAAREGAQTRGTLAASNYQAQVWAREHTSRDAVFVTHPTAQAGWRTISRRRMVWPKRTGFYMYTRSRRVEQLDSAFESFYGLEAEAAAMERGDLSPVTFSELTGRAYAALEAEDLECLARLAGGDYVVRRVDESVSLPLVYQNEHLRIYRLGGSAGASGGCEARAKRRR